jgi:hypothetical protein
MDTNNLAPSDTRTRQIGLDVRLECRSGRRLRPGS